MPGKALEPHRSLGLGTELYHWYFTESEVVAVVEPLNPRTEMAASRVWLEPLLRKNLWPPGTPPLYCGSQGGGVPPSGRSMNPVQSTASSVCMSFQLPGIPHRHQNRLKSMIAFHV